MTTPLDGKSTPEEIHKLKKIWLCDNFTFLSKSIAGKLRAKDKHRVYTAAPFKDIGKLVLSRYVDRHWVISRTS
jgi:HD-like signal output (HDOD) protein